MHGSPRLINRELSDAFEDLKTENVEYKKYRSYLKAAVKKTLESNEKLLHAYKERCKLLDTLNDDVSHLCNFIQESTNPLEKLKLKNSLLRKLVINKHPKETIKDMVKLIKKYKNDISVIGQHLELIKSVKARNPDVIEELSLLENELKKADIQNKKLKEINKSLDEELDKYNENVPLQCCAEYQKYVEKHQSVKAEEYIIESHENNTNILRKPYNTELILESHPYFDIMVLFDEDDFKKSDDYKIISDSTYKYFNNNHRAIIGEEEIEREKNSVVSSGNVKNEEPNDNGMKSTSFALSESIKTEVNFPNRMNGDDDTQASIVSNKGLMKYKMSDKIISGNQDLNDGYIVDLSEDIIASARINLDENESDKLRRKRIKMSKIWTKQGQERPQSPPDYDYVYYSDDEENTNSMDESSNASISRKKSLSMRQKDDENDGKKTSESNVIQDGYSYVNNGDRDPAKVLLLNVPPKSIDSYMDKDQRSVKSVSSDSKVSKPTSTKKPNGNAKDAQSFNSDKRRSESSRKSRSHKKYKKEKNGKIFRRIVASKKRVRKEYIKQKEGYYYDLSGEDEDIYVTVSKSSKTYSISQKKRHHHTGHRDEARRKEKDEETLSEEEEFEKNKNVKRKEREKNQMKGIRRMERTLETVKSSRKVYVNIEVNTDDSALGQSLVAMKQHKKLDNDIKQRQNSELYLKKKELANIKGFIDSVKEKIKDIMDKRQSKISRLKYHEPGISRVEFKPGGNSEKKVVSVNTDLIPDVDRIKMKLIENNDTLSQSFLFQQQFFALKEQLAEKELEINLINVSNGKKNAELAELTSKLKSRDTLKPANETETASDISVNKEKIRRRKARLAEVKRIMDQKYEYLENLKHEQAELQSINDKLNKEIKKKLKEPKENVQSVCTDLRSCREYVKNRKKETDFLRIEESALEALYDSIKSRISDQAEADIKNKISKFEARVKELKSEFINQKGKWESNSFPLSCEQEVLLLDAKLKETKKAVDVANKKHEVIIAEIKEITRKLTDAGIRIPPKTPLVDKALTSDL